MNIDRVERQHLPSWGVCSEGCGRPIVARVYFDNGWVLFYCAAGLQRACARSGPTR